MIAARRMWSCSCFMAWMPMGAPSRFAKARRPAPTPESGRLVGSPCGLAGRGGEWGAGQSGGPADGGQARNGRRAAAPSGWRGGRAEGRTRKVRRALSPERFSRPMCTWRRAERRRRETSERRAGDSWGRAGRRAAGGREGGDGAARGARLRVDGNDARVRPAALRQPLEAEVLHERAQLRGCWQRRRRRQRGQRGRPSSKGGEGILARESTRSGGRWRAFQMIGSCTVSWTGLVVTSTPRYGKICDRRARRETEGRGSERTAQEAAAPQLQRRAQGKRCGAARAPSRPCCSRRRARSWCSAGGAPRPRTSARAAPARRCWGSGRPPGASPR